MFYLLSEPMKWLSLPPNVLSSLLEIAPGLSWPVWLVPFVPSPGQVLHSVGAEKLLNEM